MATAVPSRFAVLAIEDDDFKPKKTAKPANSVKANQKNKSDKTKQQPKKQDDKKKQSKNKKKKNVANDQQWEQWKQKDSMAVEESYEQDLHQAIMLSKIAYESQMENGSKTDKEQEQTKKGNSKKSKKSTMSLEEFNNLGNNPTQSINEKSINSNGKEKHLEADPEYFERVQKEASQEIMKGKEKDLLKARLNQIDNNEITSAQLRVELEKRDDIIKDLKDDVFKLKEELSQVKNRNKKLYQILAQGEMKDKAAVLAEVAKLQEIRDELTSEVSSLHAQLEQERSKNHASNSEAKPVKQNSKKRLASENA